MISFLCISSKHSRCQEAKGVVNEAFCQCPCHTKSFDTIYYCFQCQCRVSRESLPEHCHLDEVEVA